MKCIVVEDDPFWMEEISAAMSAHGVEVLQATTAAEGVRLVSREPGSAMILDIILPDQDGLEVLRDVRAVRPDVRVLAISGGGRLGADFYLKLAQAFGADAIIEKPFTAAALVAAWDKVVAV